MSQFENADGRNFLRWILNVTTASTARLLSLADWSLNWQTCQRSTRGNISICQSIGVKWLWKVFLDSSWMRFQEWWPCFLAALLHWPLKVRPWQVLASSGMPSQLYIRLLAHQLPQSIQDNPNENDLTFERSRKTKKDAKDCEEHEQFGQRRLWGAGQPLRGIRSLCHHSAEPTVTYAEAQWGR